MAERVVTLHYVFQYKSIATCTCTCTCTYIHVCLIYMYQALDILEMTSLCTHTLSNIMASLKTLK